MIYVLHARELRLVKIGYTDGAVATRVAAISHAAPCALHVVGVLDGGRAMEKRLHDYFAANRVRGEWFSDAILTVLQEKLAPYAG